MDMVNIDSLTVFKNTQYANSYLQILFSVWSVLNKFQLLTTNSNY